MHAAHLAGALAVLASTAVATPRVPPIYGPPAPASRPVLKAMGTGGLRFEPNRGQTDPRVRYLARMGGATLFVTNTEAVLRLSGPRPVPDRLAPGPTARTTPQRPAEPDRALRMRLEGASASPKSVGLAKLPGVVNYYIGNDPQKWRTNIPTYGKVKLSNVYPKTDLVYYDAGGRLEYDFVLKPGADPKRIAMRIDGADRMRVAGGDLVLTAGGREIRWRKPIAYQVIGGRRVAVACRYDVRGSRVAFQVARHDPSRSLVVDPVLVYSSYLGGSSGSPAGGWYTREIVHHGALAYGPDGSIHLAGITPSVDFPGASGPCPAGQNAFVTKLSADGRTSVYTAIVGGSSIDGAEAVAVDGAGCAYVAGTTGSKDFPTTDGALQEHADPSAYCDGFITKISAAGTALVYSTYYGGAWHEECLDIAVDAAGCAYVTGYTASPDLPGAPGAPLGLYDSFVLKISTDGATPLFAKLIGGHETYGIVTDVALGIAVDTTGHAYVTGYTDAPDFPTTDGAVQTSLNGGHDAFLVKLSETGLDVVYGTYLGGSGPCDVGYAVCVDAAGHAYVAGRAEASDFLAPLGPPDSGYGGGTRDGFVAKLDVANGALLGWTFVGGNGDDIVFSMALCGDHGVALAGWTSSTDLPVTNDASQRSLGGGYDGFVCTLTPDLSAPGHCTYLGGTGDDSTAAVASDSSGRSICAAGGTTSSDLPVTNDASQTTLRGQQDAFIAIFRDRDTTAPDISILVPAPITYLLNQDATVSFTIEDVASGVDWSSVVSTQPNGSTLDTSTTGTIAFTVSAADLVGNAKTESVSYSVGWAVCALYDQSKAHKSGSTIPIKVRLVDANGTNVSGASPIVRAVRIERVSDSAPGVLEDSGNANPDYCFRYSEDLGGYIYNLSLKGYQTGTYRMHFKAGSDPTDHTVQFQVK